MLDYFRFRHVLTFRPFSPKLPERFVYNLAWFVARDVGYGALERFILF